MESEFFRSWTKQLYSEYEQISYQYALKLNPVIIQILPLDKILGYWDSDLRKITLSASLIENHPWNIVLEVFKHEIAHQLVDERMGGGQAHGEKFHTACTHLCVASWAQKPKILLSQDIHQGERKEDQLLFRKIKKLLALSQSSNKNEAVLALQKARELTTKYKGMEEKTPFSSLMITHKKKRIENYQASICDLLVQHFSVKVIFSSLYDAKDCCSYQAIEVLGKRHQIEVAEYVYWFFFHQLRLLWEGYRKPSSGIKKRNQFYQGVIHGFREKLESTQPGLILMEEKALSDYTSMRYPKIRWSQTRRRQTRGQEYFAGKARGKKNESGPRGKKTI